MEFAPTEVKMAVAGYGQADKQSVLKMVRLILRVPDLNVIDDAVDALAIAIAAAQKRT
jgi:crossover junction endodeoxyribonuclease RuvC